MTKVRGDNLFYNDFATEYSVYDSDVPKDMIFLVVNSKTFIVVTFVDVVVIYDGTLDNELYRYYPVNSVYNLVAYKNSAYLEVNEEEVSQVTVSFSKKRKVKPQEHSFLYDNECYTVHTKEKYAKYSTEIKYSKISKFSVDSDINYILHSNSQVLVCRSKNNLHCKVFDNYDAYNIVSVYDITDCTVGVLTNTFNQCILFTIDCCTHDHLQSKNKGGEIKIKSVNSANTVDYKSVIKQYNVLEEDVCHISGFYHISDHILIKNGNIFYRDFGLKRCVKIVKKNLANCSKLMNIAYDDTTTILYYYNKVEKKDNWFYLDQDNEVHVLYLVTNTKNDMRYDNLNIENLFLFKDTMFLLTNHFINMYTVDINNNKITLTNTKVFNNFVNNVFIIKANIIKSSMIYLICENSNNNKSLHVYEDYLVVGGIKIEDKYITHCKIKENKNFVVHCGIFIYLVSGKSVRIFGKNNKNITIFDKFIISYKGKGIKLYDVLANTTQTYSYSRKIKNIKVKHDNLLIEVGGDFYEVKEIKDKEIELKGGIKICESDKTEGMENIKEIESEELYKRMIGEADKIKEENNLEKVQPQEDSKNNFCENDSNKKFCLSVDNRVYNKHNSCKVICYTSNYIVYYTDNDIYLYDNNILLSTLNMNIKYICRVHDSRLLVVEENKILLVEIVANKSLEIKYTKEIENISDIKICVYNHNRLVLLSNLGYSLYKIHDRDIKLIDTQSIKYTDSYVDIALIKNNKKYYIILESVHGYYNILELHSQNNSKVYLDECFYTTKNSSENKKSSFIARKDNYLKMIQWIYDNTDNVLQINNLKLDACVENTPEIEQMERNGNKMVVVYKTGKVSVIERN